MPANTIGHSHGTKIVIPQTDARLPTANGSPVTPGHGHGLHIVIPPTDARIPAPLDTPGHGHTNAVLSTETTATTPGHGHGLFAFPPGTNSPVHPRPSARVSRRGSLFSAADDGKNEDEETRNAVEHPLLGIAHANTMPPTSEADEQSSAELDGHFDQPSCGHDKDAGPIEASAHFGSTA
ncbi:hypothetical protein C8Q70DRAFT_262453 [Cubamyces menziesii]|uniref:Uncharacterized protein n=1 Tax=Trametes cubensis TaxID=1111947 RepID=A0AAD7U1W5_9APHY|nr:hypothetical protein C8Q70DRAFT_262453 [Cubamyces menziesii]KAJ8490137.1 hypothetical protein ONZ51_g2486 [Trametes cubensis]